MSYKKYVGTGIDLKMFQKKLLHATHDELSVFHKVKTNTIRKIWEKILSGHETDDSTRFSEKSCRMTVSHTHTHTKGC